MSFITSLPKSQPFKFFYVFFVLGWELARLPFQILYWLPRGNRPHKDWSLRRTIKNRVFKAAVYHYSVIEIRTPLSLKPGAEKDRWVVFDPAPESYYQGPLVDANIKPEKIGGTWYPEPYPENNPAKDDEIVILHCHGGAYVLGDGRQADTAFACNTLAAHAGATRVFAPQYRLASNPNCSFPAAIQDAVTSYYYLVNTLKISPSKIIISGDSAGGNMAITLLRYIAEFGTQVGLASPSAAFLWSPWLDLDGARQTEHMDESQHYKTDYLCGLFTRWGALCYVGDRDGSTPYFSPLGNPFKTATPLWMQTGSSEILYESNLEFAGQMKEAGNDMTVLVEDAVHDIILLGDVVDFVEEAQNCAKKAAEWYRELPNSIQESK